MDYYSASTLCHFILASGDAAVGIFFYPHPHPIDEMDTIKYAAIGLGFFGEKHGVLQNELSYFAECIREGKTPDVITPEQSREAVALMCAAERSADTNEVVKP